MQSLLSSHWYRVRGLRPRLRGHVQIHRHVYRGRAWFVVEDRVGGRHHRFSAGAYRVLSLMDGGHDLQSIWEGLSAELSEDTPTQDDIIRLLGQLHAADLVMCDVTPDVAELFQRRGRHVRRRWAGRLANPMALRLPLFDPDALVARLARRLRPLDGPLGIALWLIVVLPALFIAAAHVPDLTGNAGERLLASDNLLMMAVLFPLVKIVHEFGHALACRLRGGEVHETGLMLLVLFPVPYVDVSNASAFVGKWQRALVGAAGMLAELFIAALAFYLWLLLEHGVARAVAYNVAVLASLTTLFFNANPLLRYDGYYILADLIEVPNLGPRASRHWQSLAERYLLGVRRDEPAPATPGERRWFIAYAPLSLAYRVLVSIGIALFVAQKFFVVGVLIALWTLTASLLWPVFEGLRALWTAPRFAGRGPRVRGVLAGGVALLALLLFVVPVPYHTTTEGVLWLPERAILRAQGSGFVHRVLARPGQALAPGQAVIESVDPTLAARIEAQAARVEEVSGRYDAAWGVKESRARQLEEDLLRERAALARLQDDAQRLTLRTAVAGVLLMDGPPQDLPGRYLRKGDVVGYLRTADVPLVRGAVLQSDVDALRSRTRTVEVRLTQSPGMVWRGNLGRGVPAATHQLPSAALGTKGGGAFISDPRDDKGLATLESVFEFELELPTSVPHEFLGSRVQLRFEHEAEPVGLRLARALRRAFLAHLQV